MYRFRQNEECPYIYRQFCRMYQKYAPIQKVPMRIKHKPERSGKPIFLFTCSLIVSLPRWKPFPLWKPGTGFKLIFLHLSFFAASRKLSSRITWRQAWWKRPLSICSAPALSGTRRILQNRVDSCKNPAAQGLCRFNLCVTFNQLNIRDNCWLKCPFVDVWPEVLPQ